MEDPLNPDLFCLYTDCAGQYVAEYPMEMRVLISDDFNSIRYDNMMTRWHGDMVTRWHDLLQEIQRKEIVILVIYCK